MRYILCKLLWLLLPKTDTLETLSIELGSELKTRYSGDDCLPSLSLVQSEKSPINRM